MSNPEKYYKPTESQSEEADNLVEKRGITYEQAYEQLGVKSEPRENEKNLDKFEQDAAKDVLKAMRLFGRKNRGIGLTRAIESDHQNIAGRYNESHIDIIEKNEKHYFDEASVKIRRAVGSKAMNLIGFSIDANEASDELLNDLPENIFKRYFVYENNEDKKQKSNERTKLYKKLNNIAKPKSR